MPARIKLARQRAEIATMLLSIMRLTTAYSEQENYGADMSDSIICCAVYIGQFERRPMSPGKLASYTGIPRPTVIRRLAAMAAIGRVEKLDGHYILPIARLNEPQVIESVRMAERIIHITSAKLSKMDTSPIATKSGSS